MFLLQNHRYAWNGKNVRDEKNDERKKRNRIEYRESHLKIDMRVNFCACFNDDGKQVSKWLMLSLWSVTFDRISKRNPISI